MERGKGGRGQKMKGWVSGKGEVEKIDGQEKTKERGPTERIVDGRRT